LWLWCGVSSVELGWVDLVFDFDVFIIGFVCCVLMYKWLMLMLRDFDWFKVMLLYFECLI